MHRACVLEPASERPSALLLVQPARPSATVHALAERAAVGPARDRVHPGARRASRKLSMPVSRRHASFRGRQRGASSPPRIRTHRADRCSVRTCDPASGPPGSFPRHHNILHISRSQATEPEVDRAQAGNKTHDGLQHWLTPHVGAQQTAYAGWRQPGPTISATRPRLARCPALCADTRRA